MTTILSGVSVPVMDGDSITMSYRVEDSKLGNTDIELSATITPGILPEHKVDAISMAGMLDSVQCLIKQKITAFYRPFNATMKEWRTALSDAVEVGDGDTLAGLMRNKPEKPELSDAVSAAIEPYQNWVDNMAVAWRGAKKHTLSVYGSGADNKTVVWTGTLSSLIGRRPTIGRIAKGARVR